MKGTSRLNHSRKLAILCVMLVALAASLASAQPASAASGVVYCFKYSNGAAYSNAPVFLQIRKSSGWTNLLRSETNIHGCGLFTMGSYTNYQVRVLAQQDFYSPAGFLQHSWLGVTPFIAPAGIGNFSLGIGRVCYFGCWAGCAAARSFESFGGRFAGPRLRAGSFGALL